MRRMYSEKFILNLEARIEALESKVEELEARANYEITISDDNKLVIDDLNDNEED